MSATRAFSKKLRMTPLMKAAVCGGGLLYLLGFLLLKVEVPSEPKANFPASYVQFPSVEEVHHNLLIREQSDLFDTAPLFLPTPWNYASDLKDLKFDYREAPLFEPFLARISLSEESLQGVPGAGIPVMNRPRDLLKNPYWDFFSLFGQEADPTVKIPERSGYLEIQQLSHGQIVRRAVNLQEGQGLSPLAFWLPMVFQVAIDDLGTIGHPLMRQSSGMEEVDRVWWAYLMKSEVLADFKPGYYKITIGP